MVNKERCNRNERKGRTAYLRSRIEAKKKRG